MAMANHGNQEQFHIDEEIITPAELNSWLTTLENGLTQEELSKKRVIILGFCFSGSFIEPLSGDGRIIVTSAAGDEVSYKGPQESDGIRSGEFFLEEFFNQLGRGYNLKDAFQEATKTTEDFTPRDGNSANTNNQYFDDSVQHPQLDDNGDGVGTNEITDGNSDGEEAAKIIFGTGATYINSDIDNPAEIVANTETKHLADTESSADLWVSVNDPDKVFEFPWFEVRPPSRHR